ncbi:MAG: C1 family peptidase, partial [candidate division WOR-3 bacterium]
MRPRFLMILLSLLMVAGIAQSAMAQQYGLGDIPLDTETYNKYLKTYPDQMRDGLPTAYDARTAGIVTAPKNQGRCGSCWAFASAGAMESHILKNGGAAYDLSEQQQVSCNAAQAGCCGGSSTAPQYWQATGPIQESCGPYAESSTSCPTEKTATCASMSGCNQLSYRVTNWHTVAAADFKSSLYNYGPSYWRYDVYSDFYAYWNTVAPGAVYTNTGGTKEGGHAVLLIGWDDAKGAYLCKNSWGATGGPNGDGTFWLAYTGHT